MAKEALEKIKEAEDRANKIVQEAYGKSKEMLSNVELEGKRLYDEMLKVTKKEAEDLKTQIRQNEENSLEGFLKESKDKVNQIENMDLEVLEDAAKKVYERIVGKDGNS